MSECTGQMQPCFRDDNHPHPLSPVLLCRASSLARPRSRMESPSELNDWLNIRILGRKSSGPQPRSPNVQDSVRDNSTFSCVLLTPSLPTHSQYYNYCIIFWPQTTAKNKGIKSWWTDLRLSCLVLIPPVSLAVCEVSSGLVRFLSIRLLKWNVGIDV